MIKREIYLNKIIPFIDIDLIKVITGIRRCGKTVLLSQIQEFLLENKNIKEENIIAINFESARYDHLKENNKLYDYIIEKVSRLDNKVYIFIDEIQEVENWQRIINSFRVDFDCDIYITGSNSKLLSGELATYLAGRYIQIPVYPFSFKELKKLFVEQNKFTTNEQLFSDYLNYGGFPQRCYFQDDSSINTFLKDLYETIIIKDIMNRHKIKDVALLRKIISFILDNIANPFSSRSIVKTLESQGTKISISTLLNYIEYSKEAFIISCVNRYDITGKKLLSTQEKYYSVDIGIRNCIKNSEKIDLNKLYENIVFLEMLIRGYEIHVGKLGNKEIDFICYKGKEKVYIQVAYLINENDRAREFGNLEKINDNYPKYVISSDLVDMSQNGIIHKNIIQFLLEE